MDDKYLFTDSSTSDGSQIKYYKDGYWYKQDNKGGEGRAEYLASVVLKCSTMAKDDFVEYREAIINGKPGCCSRDCLNEGESLVSFYRLWAGTCGGDIAAFLQRMDYDDAIEKVLDFAKEQTGLDLHEYLADNMYISEFIRNEDLHFNNLWVIFGKDGFRRAPVMDNGRSMFVGNDRYSPDKSFEENMKQTHSKIFSPDYNLNFRYLEKWRTVRIDKDALIMALQKEEASVQRDFLLYRCENDMF